MINLWLCLPLQGRSILPADFSMLLMMLARDSHLGHGRKFSTGQGAAGCSWAQAPLAAPEAGGSQLAAGCTVWQLHSANWHRVGLKVQSCNSGPAAATVTQRTQWRANFQILGSSMCQQSSHTPPLGGHAPPPIWLSAVQFWVRLFVLTHHPLIPPHGPFLAAMTEEAKHDWGERGLQPTMDPMTPRVQLSSVFQERFSLQLTWYLGELLTEVKMLEYQGISNTIFIHRFPGNSSREVREALNKSRRNPRTHRYNFTRRPTGPGSGQVGYHANRLFLCTVKDWPFPWPASWYRSGDHKLGTPQPASDSRPKRCCPPTPETRRGAHPTPKQVMGTYTRLTRKQFVQTQPLSQADQSPRRALLNSDLDIHWRRAQLAIRYGCASTW